MDVGAGDVQFVGRDALGLVEPLDDPDVFAHRIAKDVDDDLAVGITAKRGQLAFKVILDPNILQPDGIEHSGRRLHNARRAWPAIGSSEIPLVTNPPIRSRETISSNSMP